MSDRTSAYNLAFGIVGDGPTVHGATAWELASILLGLLEEKHQITAEEFDGTRRTFTLSGGDIDAGISPSWVSSDVAWQNVQQELTRLRYQRQVCTESHAGLPGSEFGYTEKIAKCDSCALCSNKRHGEQNYYCGINKQYVVHIDDFKVKNCPEFVK
jgi:hypothetical protein